MNGKSEQRMIVVTGLHARQDVVSHSINILISDAKIMLSLIVASMIRLFSSNVPRTG